jgi:hypothetical protein
LLVCCTKSSSERSSSVLFKGLHADEVYAHQIGALYESCTLPSVHDRCRGEWTSPAQYAFLAQLALRWACKCIKMVVVRTASAIHEFLTCREPNQHAVVARALHNRLSPFKSSQDWAGDCGAVRCGVAAGSGSTSGWHS